MAQRDIQDIANYMQQIDESIAAEEEACNEACKECEEQQALEDEELEDEVIDKEALGFIDDTDIDEFDEQVNEKYTSKKDWYKAHANKTKRKPFVFVVDFCYDNYSSNPNATEEEIANMLNMAIADVCAEARLAPTSVLASSVITAAGPGGGWPEVKIVLDNYGDAVKFAKIWCGADDIEDVAYLLSPIEEQAESDEFYSEDEDKDTFEEDVSDCMVKEVADYAPLASIDVEVYNDDGFGEHFTKEVNRNVPGVKAVVKKTLPNGDLLVTMSGEKNDLENAFAFYVGKEDYSQLSQDDKEDFESRLVFDDGDTLAEADYREAVAHCLDPIDVNASTANLADQDTCAISIIKEEKAKRLAKKALKCLQEDDFSSLSDDELDKLDKIKDAIDSGTPLNNEQNKVWQLMLKDMGFTQKEWDDLTPEQREKIWDASNQPAISRTGFGSAVHVGTDPKTDKKFRYQNQYMIDNNPETGEKDVIAFNPNYDMEHSPYQHPSAAKRQIKKDAAAVEQANKDKAALNAMRNASGKDTWDLYDFAQMISNLDGKQRKALMNDLIASVEKDHVDDPRKAGEEILFIKKIFGKKLTLRDFAKAWGKSAPGVMKFADETIDIWRKTLKDMNISSTNQFKSMPQAKFEQFLKLLKINMEGRRSGSIVAGR